MTDIFSIAPLTQAFRDLIDALYAADGELSEVHMNTVNTMLAYVQEHPTVLSATQYRQLAQLCDEAKEAAAICQQSLQEDMQTLHTSQRAVNAYHR